MAQLRSFPSRRVMERAGETGRLTAAPKEVILIC